ncbi:unnamed protein product, partial [Polarella glacialis]
MPTLQFLLSMSFPGATSILVACEIFGAHFVIFEHDRYVADLGLFLVMYSYPRLSILCLLTLFGDDSSSNPSLTRKLSAVQAVSSVLPLTILSCAAHAMWDDSIIARTCSSLLLIFELLHGVIAAWICYNNNDNNDNIDGPMPQPRPRRRFSSVLPIGDLKAEAILKALTQARHFTFQVAAREAVQPHAISESDNNNNNNNNNNNSNNNNTNNNNSNSNNNDNQLLCCICLAVFEDIDQATSLACTHVFHAACIYTWFQSVQGPFIVCPLRCISGRVDTRQQLENQVNEATQEDSRHSLYFGQILMSVENLFLRCTTKRKNIQHATTPMDDEGAKGREGENGQEEPEDSFRRKKEHAHRQLKVILAYLKDFKDICDALKREQRTVMSKKGQAGLDQAVQLPELAIKFEAEAPRGGNRGSENSGSQ